DLIKNNFLSKLEKNQIIEINDAFDQWQVILNNLEDEKIQERFLRHYYNAFKYNPEISIKGIPKATKSNLINIYEKLIDRNPQIIFEDLIEKSGYYNALIDPENSDNGLKQNLRDLLNINGAPSYQLLLYLFSKKIDNIVLNNVVEFLVKYFVRRNLTDFPNTRDLDSIFMNLITDLESDGITLEKIETNLIKPGRYSTFETFKQELEKDIYENNVGVTRFILSKIEETNSKTKEIYTNFWKRDNKGNFIWTIEHIFPQGKNITKDWTNMIANGNEKEAKKIQEEIVHTLGNLTLTGYNSKLSNMSFKDKRDRIDKQGRYVGYKNGLYLNKILTEKESWNKDLIIGRSNILIENALGIFKFKEE
ncbi:MAG: HNH endonuclease family protein, partial [Candidatus Micrarchaeia archaeon]